MALRAITPLNHEIEYTEQKESDSQQTIFLQYLKESIDLEIMNEVIVIVSYPDEFIVIIKHLDLLTHVVSIRVSSLILPLCD